MFRGTQAANEQMVADVQRSGGNLVMGDDGKLQLADDDSMGGSCEKYSWGQNETELSVKFNVAAGTKGKEVKLNTTTKSIKLSVRGEVLLDGLLHAGIISDESTV